MGTSDMHSIIYLPSILLSVSLSQGDSFLCSELKSEAAIVSACRISFATWSAKRLSVGALSKLLSQGCSKIASKRIAQKIHQAGVMVIWTAALL